MLKPQKEQKLGFLMKKMTEKIGFTIENGRRARQKNKNFY